MQIAIGNKEISVKEYQGQRVVTFRDIDTVHQRPADTAKRNFNKNRKHFIQGVDYFVRNSSEAKQELGIIAPSGINLITESGYLMLVKSFTDDLAWEVQRNLVNNYFRKKSTFDVIDAFDLNNIDQSIIDGIKENLRINSIKNQLAKYEALYVDAAGYRDIYTDLKSKHLKKYEECKIEERKLTQSLKDLRIMIDSLRLQLTAGKDRC